MTVPKTHGDRSSLVERSCPYHGSRGIHQRDGQQGSNKKATPPFFFSFMIHSFGFVLQSRRVEIAFIEPTEKGRKQLAFEDDKPLYVYPEADMLVSLRQRRTYSGFSSWGKGWADPEIRRQRLETMKRPRERKPRRERSRQQQRPLKFQKNVPRKSKE